MKDYLLPLHFDLKFGNFTLSFDRLRQRNALKFVRTCSTIIVSHSINHHVVVFFFVCVAFCRRRFLNSSRKTRNRKCFFLFCRQGKHAYQSFNSILFYDTFSKTVPPTRNAIAACFGNIVQHRAFGKIINCENVYVWDIFDVPSLFLSELFHVQFC